MIRTTLVGGALFLLPLVFLAVVFGKALEIGTRVAEPLRPLLPAESVAGVAAVDLVAIALLLAVCYVAGLLARIGAVARRAEALDARLMNLAPPYALAKSFARAITNAETEASAFPPVLVAFDDLMQIGLEVERTEDKVTVYLTGAPSPWSGTCVIVDASRVSSLALSTRETVRLAGLLGKGSLAAVAKPADAA